MHWRRGLIRLSIALTVLWAFACLYISFQRFNEVMKPYWGTADWEEMAHSLSLFHLAEAALFWATGTAICVGLVVHGLLDHSRLPWQ
jgi:hypothetical protein